MMLSTGRRRTANAAWAVLKPASAANRRRCMTSGRPGGRPGEGVVEDPATANIAVLGGGLTGLTTAYYLAKQLPPTAKITLYEHGDRLGGWIWTDRVDVDVASKSGTVAFERGPRSLSSLNANTWRYDDLVLYDLALDLGLSLSSAPNKPRYVYYPDHLVPLPPAINILNILREPLFMQSAFAGLALLWRSYGTKTPPDEDQSVASWVYDLTRSRTLADNLVSAMVHGIYGGDIDRLSARSVLDRLYSAWYIADPGPASRNMPPAEQELLDTLGKDEQIQKLALVPKGSLIHFGENGMQSLTDALANALRQQLNVTVKTQTTIDRLRYQSKNKTVEVFAHKSPEPLGAYDKVISTLSSQETARISDHPLDSLADTHSVSMTTVNLWYPQENLKPPGFGYLIPRSVPEELNPERALGVFFDSDVGVRGPNEPAGTKLFVLMGGHYYDDMKPPSDAEAIQQAKAVLERHLGIPRDTPCHAVTRFASECIPQHYVGHYERMDDAHDELMSAYSGRLAVAGGSYSRIGLMASLRAGYDIAKHTSANGLTGTGLEFAGDAGDFVTVDVQDVARVRRMAR